MKNDDELQKVYLIHECLNLFLFQFNSINKIEMMISLRFIWL